MNHWLRTTTLLAALLLIASGAIAQAMNATLSGDQEVPPADTPATGTACLSYNNDTNMLSYEVNYSGLVGAESAAHFHGPAAPGVEAGVQIGLPDTNPKVGTVGPLTSQQESDLMNGLWYINIHTDLYPGGEIRGQILLGSCESVAVEAATWGELKARFE